MAGDRSSDKDPALQIRFEVVVDGIDLGRFTACEGLSAEYEVEEYKEGGNNSYVHRLPGRMKFTNIKVTRPVDSSSGAIAAWFSKLADQGSLKRSTGHITAYGADRKQVARWNLRGVWPAKYTGPQLNITGSGAATESLELAHNGFTVEGG